MNEDLDDLKHKIESLNEQKRLDLEIKERDVAKQFNDKITELNQQIESLKSSKESEINQLKTQNELDKSKLKVKCAARDKEYMYGQRISCEDKEKVKWISKSNILQTKLIN